MIYQNPRTGIRIDLPSLNHAEQTFYRAAKQRFDDGVPWFDFDDFAFGRSSPLYRGRTSHHEVLQHPLYVALKDMWLELGVRQGRVRAETRKVFADASRRTKSGSGKAAHERDRTKTRNVALAHTSARAGH
jgi:hypothetical protein